MKNILAAFALVIAQISPSYAQDRPYSPPAAFMQQYQGMPNTGVLHLRYCLIGNHVCMGIVADAWGQVCDAGMARSMGHSHEFGWRGDIEGDIEGTVPPGYHYAGWWCVLDNPQDAKKYQTTTSGPAK